MLFSLEKTFSLFIKKKVSIRVYAASRKLKITAYLQIVECILLYVGFKRRIKQVSYLIRSCAFTASEYFEMPTNDERVTECLSW